MEFRFVLPIATLLLAISARAESAKVDRLDAALDALVPANLQIEKLASGFKWTEGPVWIHAGYLLFAEIPSNSIRKWTPGAGATIWMQPTGYQGTTTYGGPEPGSNGMTLDSKGRLTVAGHARRNVWRLESMDPKGEITVLAETYQGKPLNSPNDVVYRSDGSLYFTDPPYGLRTQNEKDPERKQPVNGVYRIRGASARKAGAAPDPKSLELLIPDLPRPNGIAFSPDESTLYVSNSEPKFWMRYRVKADGSVTDGKKLYDSEQDQAPGAPDGMKVDERGNLYSTGPGGIWIFSPEGKHLGTIRMQEKSANMAWGDADGKTLYITASTSLYRIHLKVGGKKP